MSKINFNKYKINKKNIESNLKSHLLFYFYKNILGVFAIIFHSNECLAFGTYSRCVGVVS